MVKERLGVRTVLGVSNISFGLPQRNMVNATFLAAAFGCGLDMPILNPKAKRYVDTVNTFRVLNCQDAGAVEFIERYAGGNDPYDVPAGSLVRRLMVVRTPARLVRMRGSAPSPFPKRLATLLTMWRLWCT